MRRRQANTCPFKSAERPRAVSRTLTRGTGQHPPRTRPLSDRRRRRPQHGRARPATDLPALILADLTNLRISTATRWSALIKRDAAALSQPPYTQPSVIEAVCRVCPRSLTRISLANEREEHTEETRNVATAGC